MRFVGNLKGNKSIKAPNNLGTSNKNTKASMRNLFVLTREIIAEQCKTHCSEKKP